MKILIADAFDCVGEDMADWLDLEPVDPLYRAWYPDGAPRLKGGNVEGQHDGVWTAWYPDGQREWERNFDFGIRDGSALGSCLAGLGSVLAVLTSASAFATRCRDC